MSFNLIIKTNLYTLQNLFHFYTKKLLNFYKKNKNWKCKCKKREQRVEGYFGTWQVGEWDGVGWWQTNVLKSTHHKLSVFNAGNGKIIKI